VVTEPPKEWPAMMAFPMPMVHQSCDGAGLCRWGLVVAGAAPRPACTRAVEEQHLGTAFQQGPQRQHLIPEIGAGAVDKDDRRQFRVFPGRNVNVVDAGTVYIREVADRRIAALDQP
jgi:hypothetical protein